MTRILAALKLAKETLPKARPRPCFGRQPPVPGFRPTFGLQVDAIGGSATGTVSAHNEVGRKRAFAGIRRRCRAAFSEATWCDIFPNVPPDVYKAKVVVGSEGSRCLGQCNTWTTEVDIFVRLGKEIAGDVPLKVINDGEAKGQMGQKRGRRCLPGTWLNG